MSSLADIENLIARGSIIQAIKEYRSLTGVGLRESKEAIDGFRSHGRWPEQVQRHAVQAGEERVQPSAERAAIETSMARGEKISAIKQLRESTGWGLREAKDAVDHYQHHGTWTPEVLAVLEPSTAEPDHAQASPPSPAQSSAPPAPPAQSPAPASPPSARPAPAASADDAALEAIIAALTEHLGHAPDVRLAVRAERIGYQGHLVMLGDRACFVYEQFGRPAIDPEIAYRDVTDVEVRTFLGAELHVSMGYLGERFGKLTDEDAQAALALFRVHAA